MRIVTQAPTVFTVRFYPQLDFVGCVAIALSSYLFSLAHNAWYSLPFGSTLPTTESIAATGVTASLGLVLFVFGLTQILPRCLTTTLTLDQTVGIVSLKRGIGFCARRLQFPLADVTGMHLVNWLGISPRLILWMRQGDRVQGKSLSIPVHLNIKELENVKKTVEYVLIATGQQWLTTNFSKCSYRVSWYVVQTPALLTIQTDNPEYRIRFIVDKVLRKLSVYLYRYPPRDYWFKDIQTIQLEDDYSPSGKAIPWIKLHLKNGDRPSISQDWDGMGGYREIAKYLARFMNVDLQVL